MQLRCFFSYKLIHKHPHVTPAYLAEKKNHLFINVIKHFFAVRQYFLILSSVIITLIYSPFFHMRGRYKNLPQRFYDGCHFWQQRYFLHLMPRTAVPVMARPAESIIIFPYLQYPQHPDLLRTLLHIFLNQDRDTYMLLPIPNIQIRDIHLFLLHTNIPYYFPP